MAPNNVKLVSSDNKAIVVSRSVIIRCTLIKNIITDLCDEDDDEIEVPLANVDAEILQLIIQWCEHYKDTELPAEDDESISRDSKPINSWDREFLEGDQVILYKLILAANYLNIPQLLQSCCKFVAEMIRGKSPEEIRRTFESIDPATI